MSTYACYCAVGVGGNYSYNGNGCHELCPRKTESFLTPREVEVHQLGFRLALGLGAMVFYFFQLWRHHKFDLFRTVAAVLETIKFASKADFRPYFVMGWERGKAQKKL